MYNKATIAYYKWIFFTALLPYADRYIPIFPDDIFGFNLSGFAWIIILLVSLIRVFVHFNAMTTPGWIWLPWILYISVQWLQDQTFLGLQSTLQYMVFPVVGMAASTFSYSDETMTELRKWFGLYMAMVLIGMYVAIADFGSFAKGTGNVMTLVVLGAIVLSEFWFYRSQRMLIYYALMVAVPVIAVVRMGIAMVLAMAVFHFGNKNLTARIVMAALVGCVALSVFYSPSFQKKTFYSGQGELSSLSFNNEDLNTSGRSRMWMLAEKDMKEHPWVGAGSRADLRMLIRNGYKLKELHNDFIAVRYNSGWLGLGCLLFGFIMQFGLLYGLKPKITDAYTAVVYYAALTIFVAWIGFMYTDNALKYSPFFGNLHFCLIGIVYSRVKEGVGEELKTEEDDLYSHSVI